MPSLIHALTGPPNDLTAATVVCGARDAARATWDQAQVTCPACQRGPCTCGPLVPVCPTCRASTAAQRGSPTSRPALTTEKAFQEALRQLAKAEGWLYYHTTDSRKSPAGFMDVVAVRGATLLCAELKLPGTVPTLRQREWLQALGQVERVLVRLWHPDDWQEIEEVLR